MKASTTPACCCMVLLSLLAWSKPAEAEDRPSAKPLRALINERLQPVAGVPVGRCSDAEFVRRVSLDLVGMPPSADEARAFLTDAAVDKREKLVDRLLSSPHYARHLAAALDLMLMERRPNTHVTADEWQAWLLKAVQDNKPWDVLVREILQADGADPTQRAAARFALDRNSDPNALARDIGRIFFGQDLQCAQCHDHPLVDDYLQSDYHGLLAFVAPSYALVRKEGETQITLLAEKAGSDLAFESVFLRTPRLTGPRVPGGVAIEEPHFLPGEEYEVPPADNVKSIPKFSRRGKLAELATSGVNRAFNENIANRLWAHMLGRGLVHPVDLHHPGNPAADPELLAMLATELASMKFDMKQFLREIALSDPYQRAFDLPGQLELLTASADAEVSHLEQHRPERIAAAKSSSDSYAQALAAWEVAEAAWRAAATESDAARTQYAAAKAKVDEAGKAAATATAQLQAKQAAIGSVQAAATAGQQAAQALAEDKELLDAAGKFAARAQQLADEIATLTKSLEELNAALKVASEALAPARTALDAAQAKTAPLAAAMRQAEEAMLNARRQAAADAQSLAAMDQRLATARELSKTAQLSQPGAIANAAARAEYDAALTQLGERWAADFTVAALKPLTPEQLCWSIFKVTGVYDRYWQAEAVELDKTKPLTDEQKQDPAQLAARAVELEQRTYDKLKGNVATFVSYYGAAAGQPQDDFFATADQALFAANGGSINSWVAPATGNVTERVIQQSDPRAAADELYLGVLSRLPAEAEAAEVVGYLTARGADKNVAAQELVWGLLNSAEFRFNH